MHSVSNIIKVRENIVRRTENEQAQREMRNECTI
jgi:hypothetical protein